MDNRVKISTELEPDKNEFTLDIINAESLDDIKVKCLFIFEIKYKEIATNYEYVRLIYVRLIIASNTNEALIYFWSLMAEYGRMNMLI